MIVRSFLVGAFSAIFLLAGLIPTQTHAQPTISSQVRQILPQQSVVKYPDVAVANRTVAISGGADRDTAKTWVKSVDQPTFGDPTDIGDADGSEDYTNVAVSGRSDGVITYAWIENDDSSPIKVRQRYANGTFSDEVTVVGGGAFKAHVDVASNNAGTTIIIWSENGRYRYSYSTNGNISQWFGPALVTDLQSQRRPIIAVGPSNKIGMAFGISDGDVYYGEWTGSGFSTEQVANNSNFLTTPSITFLPNGTPVIAWRRVEGGGYFYAERKGPDNWPSSFLSSDEVNEWSVTLAADEAGNLAFGWITTGSALKVAYRTADGVFSNAVQVNVNNDFRSGVNMAATVNGITQMHVAVEDFTGRNIYAEYYLLTSQGAGTMGAQPVVTSAATLNGIPIVGGSNTVRVSFSNVAGSPNQVRYRWGSAPNDTNTWLSYTNPISIPHDTALNTVDCKPEVLFTQVRNGSTVESSAKQVSLIVDRAVQGSVRAVNPYIGDKLPVFTEAAENWPFDLSSNGGASDGAPGYTRELLFYFEAMTSGDCVGLKQFQYGSSASTLGRPYGVVDDIFANVLPLPNSSNAAQGPRALFARMSDDVGNIVDYTTTITYDSIKPVLADGASMTISSDAKSTALVKLSFSGVNVTDTYPGGYWGVWVANSLTPVSNPLTATNLIWSPAEVSPNGANPVLEDWSLLNALGRTAKSFPGAQTFHVYVRFLDGAGNPTDKWVSGEITLQKVTEPTNYMPFIRR